MLHAVSMHCSKHSSCWDMIQVLYSTCMQCMPWSIGRPKPNYSCVGDRLVLFSVGNKFG